MSLEERLASNCEIIWGSDNLFRTNAIVGDDDMMTWTVERDIGGTFVPMWSMTYPFMLRHRAYDEIERILELWALRIISGAPMTLDERKDIFRGQRGNFP